MKTIIRILALGATVLALSGCSSRKMDTSPSAQGMNIPQLGEQQQTEAPPKPPDLDPWNENPEIYGNPLTVTNSKNENEYRCNVPDYNFVKESEDHKYIKCKSNHIILMGISDSSYPEGQTLEEVFESYIPRMESYLDTHHNIQASDHSLKIKEQKAYQVNDLDMIQIRGAMSFKESKNVTQEWVFLGYAVQLNSGNYAYFMVSNASYEWIDTKEIAINMAHSFADAT